MIISWNVTVSYFFAIFLWLFFQRHGAKVVGGISGKVTHALVGEEAGPGKHKNK
jgi:hypothetical protein